eukprot:6086132-Prymnesium_polylepis.1
MLYGERFSCQKWCELLRWCTSVSQRRDVASREKCRRRRAAVAARRMSSKRADVASDPHAARTENLNLACVAAESKKERKKRIRQEQAARLAAVRNGGGRPVRAALTTSHHARNS